MAELIVSHTRFNMIRPSIVIHTFNSCDFDLHKMDIYFRVWASVCVCCGKMCRTSHVLHDTTRHVHVGERGRIMLLIAICGMNLLRTFPASHIEDAPKIYCSLFNELVKQ